MLIQERHILSKRYKLNRAGFSLRNRPRRNFLSRSWGDEVVPVVGENVSIVAGAKIGANAVVLTDIPAGATAVGIPARIIPKDTSLPKG